MAISVGFTKSANIGGKSFSMVKTMTSVAGIAFEKTPGAAKTGTLTTRGSDTAGTLTLAASHGVTTGARLDIYWEGGCRRGVTVGTVATNSVPFTSGAGDALPVLTTAVTVMVPVSLDYALAYSLLKGLAVYSDKKAIIVLAESDTTEIKAYVLEDAACDLWYDGDPEDNPLGVETLGKVYMSHGSTVATANVRLGLQHD